MLLRKRESVLRNLLKTQRGLLIVYDNNTGGDEKFQSWAELGCDVIQTGWNPLHQVRVEKIRISEDSLSEQSDPGAAEQIFRYYYLQTAKDDEDTETLDYLQGLLEQEADALSELLRQIEWHPLTILLLAKQMSFSSDHLISPKQMLEELRTVGIVKHDYEDIWHERDGKDMTKNSAFGHMERIFRIVLDKDNIPREELDGLRCMMLVSSEYGISSQRFYELSGLDPEHQVLERLRSGGWIAYDRSTKDLLVDAVVPEDRDKGDNSSGAHKTDWYTALPFGSGRNAGVWRMPMLTADVLCRQPKTMLDIEMCEKFAEFVCDLDIDVYKDYPTWKAVSAHAKAITLHMKKEETAAYARLLGQCGNILHKMHEAKEDFLCARESRYGFLAIFQVI